MSLQPIDRDAVVRLVKTRGPLIPNELKKALGQGDTMLLGAMLSELNGKGQIKISKTKLGGSPFYYDPGNPASLEKIAHHLGEKDQRTWKLLKEAKVLRDDKQEALVRVSLRGIKDFAIPLNVNAPEGTVLYWKYYLLSDAEAEQMIKEALGLVKKEPKKEEPPTPEKKPEALPKEPIVPEQPKPTVPEKPPEKPKVPEPAKIEKKPEPKKVEIPPKKTEQKQEIQESLTNIEEIDDEFYKRIRNYFDKHDITIKEQELIRKKSEIDFVISMPTPMGYVDYYCKAKAKKKSNDGDLATAKLQGTTKQLPTVYLTTGEVTKKAKDKLATDFKGLVVKEL